jgi:hypothetical protein
VTITHQEQCKVGSVSIVQFWGTNAGQEITRLELWFFAKGRQTATVMTVGDRSSVFSAIERAISIGCNDYSDLSEIGEEWTQAS